MSRKPGIKLWLDCLFFPVGMQPWNENEDDYKIGIFRNITGFCFGPIVAIVIIHFILHRNMFHWNKVLVGLCKYKCGFFFTEVALAKMYAKQPSG